MDENQSQPERDAVSETAGMIHVVASLVFEFLPVHNVVRCGATSKALHRAVLTSIRSASWPRPQAEDNWHGEAGAILALDNGAPTRPCPRTPSVDLRPAGDTVHGRALLSLLHRAFQAEPTEFIVKRHESASSVHQSAVGGVGIAVRIDAHKVESFPGQRDVGILGTARQERAKQAPVLRGLAVSSSELQDDAAQEAIDLYGSGLHVLSLAGCRGLVDPETIHSIRRRCTSLASLDLSNTFMVSASGAPLVKRDHVHEVVLSDSGLQSLLHDIGGGLVTLRLFGCRTISDEGVRAIAQSCPNLRELDLGTDCRPDQSVPAGCRIITGASLAALCASPCATSLVYLGLRMRVYLMVKSIIAMCDGLPGLRRLDLAGIFRIHDDVLEAIASKLSLTNIDLSGCKNVTSRGVLYLASGSPDLSWVSLHCTAVRDSGVRALCESCMNLRYLNLSLTPITGRSLRALAEKESLRFVNLRCCPDLRGPSVTQGVSDLRQCLSAGRRLGDRCVVYAMERPERQAGKSARVDGPCLHAGKRVHSRSSGSGCMGERGSGASGNDHMPPSAGDTSPHSCGSSGSGGQIRPVSMPSIFSAVTDTEPSSSREDSRILHDPGDDLDHDTGLQEVREIMREEAATSGAESCPRAMESTDAIAGKHQELLLLTAKVGDLSLGRRPGTTTRRSEAMGVRGCRGSEARMCPGGSGAGYEGQGDETLENGRGTGRRHYRSDARGCLEEEGAVPFDWDAVPRGKGVGELGAWRGFRGLPGDVAREVILELHPFSSVDFVFKGGGSSIRPAHGYQVHKSKYGLAWVALRVDEQGCVV